ncbi:hypothetical protein [Corallibacter sp.]|uniref:hypothetical protein n=1 Tax=Corallibacter sp. TaxID=2038084 RepID=UPI003AB3B6B2
MKKTDTKIFTKEFKTNLESLLTTINESFENINNGGCAYFAQLLYPKLKELTDDIEILFFLQSEDLNFIQKEKEYYNEVKDSDDDLKEAGFVISHVILKCEEYYIDTNIIDKTIPNYFEKKYNHHLIGSISFDVLSTLIDYNEWNEAFDINDLSKIEKVIDKYFNKEVTIWDRVKIKLEENK